MFTTTAWSTTIEAPADTNEVAGMERDVQVDLTHRIHEGNIYFKLLMLNESQSGFYSMVKYFENGDYASVDVRQMVANTINQPLMYSFTDEDVPREDVTYVLYRIAEGTEEVGRWNYCSTEHTLCPDAELASR